MRNSGIVFVVIFLSSIASASQPEKIVILNPAFLEKPEFLFNSEPWFVDLIPTKFWTPNIAMAKRAEGLLLSHFTSKGYPEVVDEFDSGYRQFLGIALEDRKLLYVVNAAASGVFKTEHIKSDWKVKLFYRGELNDHSWGALVDLETNSVVGVFFAAEGLDSGYWPTIKGGRSVDAFFGFGLEVQKSKSESK